MKDGSRQKDLITEEGAEEDFFKRGFLDRLRMCFTHSGDDEEDGSVISVFSVVNESFSLHPTLSPMAREKEFFLRCLCVL
jgi:hypothetical protein